MAIEMRYIAAFHLRKRTSKCELKMAFLICRMLCQRYVWCLLLCYIRCNVCLLFFFFYSVFLSNKFMSPKRGQEEYFASKEGPGWGTTLHHLFIRFNSIV